MFMGIGFECCHLQCIGRFYTFLGEPETIFENLTGVDNDEETRTQELHREEVEGDESQDLSVQALKSLSTPRPISRGGRAVYSPEIRPAKVPWE